MKTFCEIKQLAAAKTIEIRIYDDIRPDGKNWWTGEKEPSETSANHIAEILAENPEAEQINVYINSYGGDVKEGVAIYNQLRRHKANVTVYIDGFACSIAATIAAAGDHVVMAPNALMMIHHAWMVAMGNAVELRKAADDLDIIDSAANKAYLIKSGDKLTPEKLGELLDAETWMNAEQCIEYGFADEIAGSESTVIDEAKQNYSANRASAFNSHKNISEKSFAQRLARAIEINTEKGGQK